MRERERGRARLRIGLENEDSLKRGLHTRCTQKLTRQSALCVVSEPEATSYCDSTRISRPPLFPIFLPSTSPCYLVHPLITFSLPQCLSFFIFLPFYISRAFSSFIFQPFYTSRSCDALCLSAFFLVLFSVQSCTRY